MTQPQHPKRNFSRLAGAAMLIAGSAVLATYSATIAWQLLPVINGGGSLGLLGNLGLASLHAVRTLAFDHAVALSVVRHVLILFSAFLMLLVGIALRPRRALGVTAPATGNWSAPRKGEQ
jgi:hypothetical protein